MIRKILVTNGKRGINTKDSEKWGEVNIQVQDFPFKVNTEGVVMGLRGKEINRVKEVIEDREEAEVMLRIKEMEMWKL